MSFLARSQPLRLINQAVRSPYTLRTFTASASQSKSVIDTTKDVLKTVDRKVADKLVDGIEVAETVTKKTKEVTGLDNAGSKAKGAAYQAKGAAYQAEGSVEDLAGQASGKASELAGQAKEMAGQAKGKAAEIGGDLKGKVNEVEGAAKGRSAELQGASGTAKPGVKGL